MSEKELRETIENLEMEIEELEHYTRLLLARNQRLQGEVYRLEKLVICKSEDPDEMCDNCQCWKYTRASVS